jgi:hypothetical protein
MLFDRDIEPRCSYCRYGTAMGHDEIACLKRGIVMTYGSCSMFRYEPTKRVPDMAPRLTPSCLPDEDFSL